MLSTGVIRKIRQETAIGYDEACSTREACSLGAKGGKHRVDEMINLLSLFTKGIN